MKRWKYLVFFLLGVGFFFGLSVRKGRVHISDRSVSQLNNIESFRSFCQAAVENSAIFASFKRDPIYTLFYENTTREEGERHLTYLFRHHPEFFQREILQKVRATDSIGHPFRYPYPSIGPLSPETLRCMRIAGDLIDHFGEQRRIRIIEIGGGSGSLCKVLHDLLDVEHYIIVDRNDTGALAKKHLEAHGIRNVEFKAPEGVRLHECDLLISDYGITEMGKVLQKRLIRKLLPNAKQGYFACNFYPGYFRISPMTKKDLLECIREIHPHIKILSEEPERGANNCVVIWKETSIPDCHLILDSTETGVTPS